MWYGPGSRSRSRDREAGMAVASGQGGCSKWTGRHTGEKGEPGHRQHHGMAAAGTGGEWKKGRREGYDQPAEVIYCSL